MSKDDPGDVLTKFITTGEENPAQKTLITCREQLEFYYAYRNLGREPGLEFFRDEAEEDMELCMSIGKIGSTRSEQVVEMFRSLDESKESDVGLQPVTQYNKSRRERRQ